MSLLFIAGESFCVQTFCPFFFFKYSWINFTLFLEKVPVYAII